MKKVLVQPQTTLRSTFLIWFSDRLYYVSYLLSILLILANTGFQGGFLRITLSLVITSVVWLCGFFIYVKLRERENYKALIDTGVSGRKEFVSAFSIVLTINLSILTQKWIGYPIENLWPLFYLPLFASVERLKGFHYALLIFSIWLSLFLLQANSLPELSLLSFYSQHFWAIISQCISLLFLSIILLYLVTSLKHKNASVQALLDLAKIQGHQWYERQYSRHILSTIVTAGKFLFNATSCEIIFVNSQTEVCYIPKIESDIDDESIYKERGPFFRPNSALSEAISTGNPTWDLSNLGSNWKSRLLQWLSTLLPFKTSNYLYLPIYKHPSSSTVVAIMKLQVETNILGIKLAGSELKQDLESITQGFSELLHHRELVQVIRIINRISQIAARGKETSLFREIANDFAYLFACPCTVWINQSDSGSYGILRIVTTSRWFLDSEERSEFSKIATIMLGKGRLGEIILRSGKYSPSPVWISASDTEHSGIYKKLNIKSLVVLPFATEKGPVGAIILNLLTETDFDEGDKLLMGLLGRQASLAFERHRTISFYRELPNVIGKVLRVTESDPNQLTSVLAQQAINILEADIVDIHLMEKKDKKITTSVRYDNQKRQEVYRNLTDEEEEIIQSLVEKPFSRFLSSVSGEFLKILPSHIKSYAVLPLSFLGTVKGILVIGYCKHHTFPLERKVLHSVFSLIAEHLFTLKEYRAELRRKLAAEESERLARKIHNSISDYLLAIKNWAQGATYLLQDPNTTPNDFEKYLAKISELALLSHERVRKIPDELWSPDLEEVTQKGLVKAINDYYDILQSPVPLSLEPNFLLSNSVPIHIQVDLLQICKQALSNAVRHAHAGKIEVELRATQTMVSMSINDDGIGFDPSLFLSPTSYGLKSIEDFVNELGGTSTISSAPGFGTRIIIDIPLKSGMIEK